MSDATEYYQRGLSFLSEKPPNLIKALSLIRKSKLLFERQGNDKESEAAQDKIYYIYMSITEKEYNQSKNLLTVAAYEKALSKAMDATKHLEKSHPRYGQKTLKKIQNLIEQISVEILFDIERNQSKVSIDESLSKLHYVERIILDVFYPQLKPTSSEVEIPDNFITEIQDKRKIQRAFINIYESLGNQARKIGKNYIQQGNITQGSVSIELAKKLYKTANFKQRIQDLNPLYRKIHEAQGDLAYTYAETLVEDERLEKARNQLRNARKLYTKSQNDKKKKAAEELFLKVSVDLGNHYLEDAEKAIELNDLKSTVDYLVRAHDFFEKINHKRLREKTEQKLNRVYTLLGDKEIEVAEGINSGGFDYQDFKNLDADLYSFHSEFFITSEAISQKLQRLHGASYYYQKAHNDIQFKKTERNILTLTEKLANLFLNQGKKDFKSRQYEKAQIHLKKGLFYSKNDDRRIPSINIQLQKISKKVNPQKLEKIKNVIIQYNELISEKITDPSGAHLTDLHGDSPDQQYRCKNCGDWVPGYYYDSIQERCFECRAKIHCDECRKTIGPNEIYQKCTDCGSIFCLECAERVFDFIQKKCMSCRVVEICEECQKEARPTESFHACPTCNKTFCNDHFDFSQGVCLNCRKAYSCVQCDRELQQEDAFMCDVCKRTYCAEHFDIGRNTCKQDAKEEICAKCGTVLKIEDHANKCKKCQFMYCDNHYSDFHEMCMVCLPKLECNSCGKDLTKERFFQCNDCQKVFCRDHFRSNLGRCLTCSEKMGTGQVSIGSQPITQSATQMYDLQANTLRPIITKYNKGDVLESEEIAFLMHHQVNLPADEEKYMNIGAMDKIMVLIRRPDNKPYVVLVPETPIHLDAKYYGDLFRKLILYLPEVPETIDGITSIVNLLFYAVNNPRWVEIYEILQQTLLKIGIDVLQILVLVFRKATIQDISKTISNSIIVDVFSGVNITDALKFIKINDSEDEVGLFSSNERLDQFLKVLYNINRGDVLRAAENFALFEINP